MPTATAPKKSAARTPRTTLSNARGTATSRLRSLPADLRRLPTEVSKVPAQLQKLPAEVAKVPGQLQKLPAEVAKVPAELQKRVRTIPTQLQERLPAQLKSGYPAQLKTSYADVLARFRSLVDTVVSARAGKPAASNRPAPTTEAPTVAATPNGAAADTSV